LRRLVDELFDAGCHLAIIQRGSGQSKSEKTPLNMGVVFEMELENVSFDQGRQIAIALICLGIEFYCLTRQNLARDPDGN
jgi:hypothetical protein